MKALKPLVWSVGLLIWAISANTVSGAPKDPIDFTVDMPFRSEEDVLHIAIEIADQGQADGLDVAVEGDGALSLHPFSEVVQERAHTLEFAVRPLAAGTGSLTITARALDDAGEVLYWRRIQLYSLVEDGVIWSSSSSLTDVRMRRLEYLAPHKVLASEEHRRELADILTARPVEDSVPRPVVPLTPHQRKLERAFEGLARVEELPVTAAPKGAVSIDVEGVVQWTDRNGGVHPLPRATVEIRDDDVIGSNLITTTTTDSAGRYAASFSHDDGALQGDPDVFVRVLARSPVADLKPEGIFADTYRMDSSVQADTPDGSMLTINLTAGNTDDNETVFSVHHALVAIGGYASNLTGRLPSRITTRFPTTSGTSRFTGSELHILRLDRWDWDVIHHEYGHYVMNIGGFVNNPGGGHSSRDNLTARRGSKDIGIRLAWGEGWPTFFGLAGQSASGMATLGVPNVGDTRYQDTEDSSIDDDLETRTGLGEDNELSVAAVLWDLFDTRSDGLDEVRLSDRSLYLLLRSAGPVHVGGAWEAFAAPQDNRGKALLGAAFAQSDIAPELTGPDDNVTLTAGAAPPTFTWLKNGGGTPNPHNDFTIKFYTNDFSTVIFEKTLGDTNRFTPTAAELATILGSGTPVKWIVEGRDTRAPVTPGGALDFYWSQARTIGGVDIALVIDDTGSMTEEIAGVRNALQSFIDEVESRLGPDDTPPTLQLITFKDSVTNRIVSNDLDAVRAQVAALTASGGGDCPEFSAQAVQLAAANVSPGGTILLATDASSQPGVDMGAVVARLRSRGVTLSTILSGDCTAIDVALSGAGSFDAVSSQVKLKKPGDDDPSQSPLVDPGQDPDDSHGDSPELATPLTVGASALRGLIGLDPADMDYFRVALTAGDTYVVSVQLDDPGTDVLFSLRDQDGVGVLESRAVSGTEPVEIVFEAPLSGDYFVTVESLASATPIPYRVRVRVDVFAALTSAVELFAAAAAETNGAFSVRDEINAGDDRSYEAAIFNTLTSTLGPAVLVANPREVPRGTTLVLNLTGSDTDWRNNTTVSFSDPAIQVIDVAAQSSTSLDVTVSVGPMAALDHYDVEVQTPLEELQIARGRDVVRVVENLGFPTLLSVEPSTLRQGEIRTVTLRGLNTGWEASSTVDLGDGVTIDSVDVLSPTLISSRVTVDPRARIGFRIGSVNSPSQTDVKQRAVLVTTGAGTVPEIIALDPAEGAPGEVLDVSVIGANTSFTAGTTTASFGPEIDVVTVDVIDSSTALVRIEIAPGAVAGFRDVSLTTGSEVAVILDGFFVTTSVATPPPPEIPTLSQWGMLFLLLSLALLALRRLARLQELWR